jgi:hypothetical protein
MISDATLGIIVIVNVNVYDKVIQSGSFCNFPQGRIHLWGHTPSTFMGRNKVLEIQN